RPVGIVAGLRHRVGAHAIKTPRYARSTVERSIGAGAGVNLPGYATIGYINGAHFPSIQHLAAESVASKGGKFGEGEFVNQGQLQSLRYVVGLHGPGTVTIELGDVAQVFRIRSARPAGIKVPHIFLHVVVRDEPQPVGGTLLNGNAESVEKRIAVIFVGGKHWTRKLGVRPQSLGDGAVATGGSGSGEL